MRVCEAVILVLDSKRLVPVPMITGKVVEGNFGGGGALGQRGRDVRETLHPVCWTHPDEEWGEMRRMGSCQ